MIIEIKKGGSNMERFIIVDYYDYPEVIGRTNSEEEAKRIRNERYDDTDDEADVYIYDMENTMDYIVMRDYGFLNFR